jgi:regulator of Ty1 transposition protein 103
VNEATELLASYNARLQQELVDRRKVGQMIADFMAAQKDLLTQAEERLELYRDKLDKVNTIREDLKSHIQSLPDLTKLPDVTGGLAPLPSAGDLFTMK